MPAPCGSRWPPGRGFASVEEADDVSPRGVRFEGVRGAIRRGYGPKSSPGGEEEGLPEDLLEEDVLVEGSLFGGGLHDDQRGVGGPSCGRPEERRERERGDQEEEGPDALSDG